MSERPLLEGLRVVELATFVFGPAAGTVLGDFGAEVIHIEHPQTGDPYRMLPQLKPLPECEENYCWMLTARGKKSIALDVRKPEGREVAREDLPERVEDRLLFALERLEARQDRRQRLGHSVDERLDPDKAGAWMLFGLRDHVLAATESDLEADAVDRIGEQQPEVGRGGFGKLDGQPRQ